MKREDHFRLLASVALIDGRLDERERDRLLALARLMALRPAKAEEILQDLAKGTKLSGLKVPKRRVLRLALFQDLVMLAAEDGEVAPQEHRFLSKLAPHFRIEPAELEQLIESSLQAVAQSGGAPLPGQGGSGLPELLREVHAARDGLSRARIALRLLRETGELEEDEVAHFLRLAARHKVEEAAARELLAEPAPEDTSDPVPPRDQRDGIKAFGALAGLIRLRQLAKGEEDLLARLAAPFGVGRVLLRQTLRAYAPSKAREE